MHFSFELDSILKYESYTSEELKSDPLTITFKKAETFGYNEREGKFYYESIEYQFENKTIQLSHEDNTYKYSFKSDDSYLTYFEIPKDELLYNIEFEIEFPNNKFTNNDFFDINTNKIVGLTNGGSTFQLYFKEGLDESQYTNVYSFYNTITSNIDDLVEEVNSDIVLNIRDCGTPHCDRWKGNALMNLDRPIVKDFTGDGVNDIVGRTYTHYFGDIDWQLTEDEKKMYFSRWVLLEGIKSDNGESNFKLHSKYEQIDEGISLFSKDLDGDGDLDIYVKPDVYHGYSGMSNKPTDWNGGVVVYINDGNGNFSVYKDFEDFPKRSFIGQIDNDSDIESVSSVGVYSSQYLGMENSSVLKIIDKVDGEYKEIKSDEIFLNPKDGKKIFQRTVVDLELHDFNNDTYKDILIWLWQEEMLEEFFDNDGKFIAVIKNQFQH